MRREYNGVWMILLLLLPFTSGDHMPNKCEACQLTAKEFELKARKERMKSESAFLSVSEEVCEEMMSYKVHKEKEGLERFQKDESSTMKTLKELRERGVKVDLGMPDEMWDEPAAEIIRLQQTCEMVMAEGEETLEEWFGQRNGPLGDSLCRDVCPADAHLEL